jgi:hypothetical protein
MFELRPTTADIMIMDVEEVKVGWRFIEVILADGGLAFNKEAGLMTVDQYHPNEGAVTCNKRKIPTSNILLVLTDDTDAMLGGYWAAVTSDDLWDIAAIALPKYSKCLNIGFNDPSILKNCIIDGYYIPRRGIVKDAQGNKWVVTGRNDTHKNFRAYKADKTIESDHITALAKYWNVDGATNYDDINVTIAPNASFSLYVAFVKYNDKKLRVNVNPTKEVDKAPYWIVISDPETQTQYDAMDFPIELKEAIYIKCGVKTITGKWLPGMTKADARKYLSDKKKGAK